MRVPAIEWYKKMIIWIEMLKLVFANETSDLNRTDDEWVDGCNRFPSAQSLEPLPTQGKWTSADSQNPLMFIFIDVSFPCVGKGLRDCALGKLAAGAPSVKISHHSDC